MRFNITAALSDAGSRIALPQIFCTHQREDEMQYELVIEAPVPVWVVKDCDSKPGIWAARDNALYPNLDPAEFADRLPLFRGVSLDKFLTVLATGTDVQPTDAPIYCCDFDKAWEYGGTSMGVGPRMIYALDQSKLDRTFRILPIDATAGQITDVRKTFPNHYEDQNMTGLWFSRMDSYFPGYEMPYGYWIPGNAKEALMAIFLLGVDRDAFIGALDALRQAIK